ncbi:MAG: hypothetical protein HZY74_09640 [Brevundimonas sp.]|nr:MAG: hypothetical protein HZY74_09640 [Brevundimonas sp.]
MTDDMDTLIANIPAADSARLTELEQAVWRRIDARQDQARAAKLRLTVVACALVVGLANGGLLLLAPQSEPSEMRVFAVSAALTPMAGLDLQP